MRWWPPLIVAVIALAGMVDARAPTARALFTEGPPPAHTGGFGEPTCVQCHFGETENDPAGRVTLRGLPAATSPGERHRITVVVARPAIAGGGFQLSARWADGPRAGAQAGTLRSVDSRARVVPAGVPAIQYAQHTAAGTALPAAGSARWTVEWIAPGGGGSGSIIFHVAANAANGDDSQFGDFIYTRRAATNLRSEKED